MHEPGQNPQRERPQPEYDPGTPDNFLEKKNLDLKNNRAVIDALHDRELAARILRLAESAPIQQTTEEESPLQLFGIILGSMRRKLNLPVEALASRAGLEPDTVYAIELGVAPLEQVTDSLKPLGDALGGKYRYLSKILVKLSLKI